MKINNKTPSGAFVNPDGVLLFIFRASMSIQADPYKGVGCKSVEEIKVYGCQYHKCNDYYKYQQHKLFFLEKLFGTLHSGVGIE